MQRATATNPEKLIGLGILFLALRWCACPSPALAETKPLEAGSVIVAPDGEETLVEETMFLTDRETIEMGIRAMEREKALEKALKECTQHKVHTAQKDERDWGWGTAAILTGFVSAFFLGATLL